MTFKAVIWDFGGVITSSPFDAFNAYEAGRGLPHNVIRGINAINPDTNAWAQLERSEVDGAGFDGLFAAEAAAIGHDIRGSAVLGLLSGTVRPRMVAALDACKVAGLQLGCITNNAPVGQGAGMSTDRAASERVTAVLARFDHVIESSKAGVRKPDPRIYRMMTDALEVVPQACIYLDDLGINCKPAAAMGMAAIKVSSEDQALLALGALLAMDFS
jgi:putative hydrolase of the HAD superfamily